MWWRIELEKLLEVIKDDFSDKEEVNTVYLFGSLNDIIGGIFAIQEPLSDLKEFAVMIKDVFL